MYQQAKRSHCTLIRGITLSMIRNLTVCYIKDYTGDKMQDVQVWGLWSSTGFLDRICTTGRVYHIISIIHFVKLANNNLTTSIQQDGFLRTNEGVVGVRTQYLQYLHPQPLLSSMPMVPWKKVIMFLSASGDPFRIMAGTVLHYKIVVEDLGSMFENFRVQ